MTSVVMMHVSILWTTCGVYTCLVTQLNAICLSLLLFFHNVFFLPFPTHCYPPFSFFSIFLESVLFCFTLSFWPFPVYESLLFLFVFISAFLTLPPPPHTSLSFNVSLVFLAWRTISTPLVISDSGMCLASDFCDVNRPLILRLHRKTSRLYIGLQHRSFA